MSDDTDNSVPDEADDEEKLFRRTVAGTIPLRHAEKAPEARRRVKPVARFARRDEQDVLQESLLADIDTLETSAGEYLTFKRASIGRKTMRKLARGKFSIQSEIDLHGLTAAQARDALRGFIDQCSARGYACVRVVHGKGLGSGHQGPVLKHRVNSWLRQWDEVLAFASTRQVHGGTGALYVLLKCS